MIGQTKIEAIDWIQEKLDYARRDVAEETLGLLLEDGIAKASDNGVFLTEEIPEDELREKSRQAMRAKEVRNSRIMRRRSVATQRHQRTPNSIRDKHDSKITDLNYIDDDSADTEEVDAGADI